MSVHGSFYYFGPTNGSINPNLGQSADALADGKKGSRGRSGRVGISPTATFNPGTTVPASISNQNLSSSASRNIRGKVGSGTFSPQSPIDSSSSSCFGTVVGDSLYFNLKPQQPSIVCPFSFPHDGKHHVLLVIDPPNFTIPLTLNNVPLLFTGIRVDITPHLRNGHNIFAFNTMGLSTDVTASVQWQLPDDIGWYVRKITDEFPKMEIKPGMQVISDVCPISGKVIRSSGRGVDCIHCQCFDLEAFLTRARDTGCWKCPVCGNILAFSTLRHDPSYLRNCGDVFVVDDVLTDITDTFF